MADLIAALVGLFLVGPMEDRLVSALQAARAPQAVVSEVASCARDAAPRLTDRVAADPWWGVQAAVRLWIGGARPEILLVELAPGCRSAIEAGRPFWEGSGS